jgi:hypothetical protein
MPLLLEAQVYVRLVVPLPEAETRRLCGELNTDQLLLFGPATGHHALSFVSDQPNTNQPDSELLAWLQRHAATWAAWEFGLRGYAVMQGRREYRPWRRNGHLDRAGLLGLVLLEPELRYQGPA